METLPPFKQSVSVQTDEKKTNSSCQAIMNYVSGWRSATGCRVSPGAILRPWTLSCCHSICTCSLNTIWLDHMFIKTKDIKKHFPLHNIARIMSEKLGFHCTLVKLEQPCWPKTIKLQLELCKCDFTSSPISLVLIICPCCPRGF